MARAKVWITAMGVLLLVASWSVEDAHAGDKMRVCVLKIAGARNDNFKNDLVRLINQPYSILKSQTFFKAAKRMRIGKRLSPPNLRRLSKFLRLGAIVDGTLVAKNGRYQLVLKVRDGKTGSVSERIRHTLRKKEMSSSEKTRVRRDLISALERIRLDSAENTSSGGFGRDEGDGDEVEEEKEEEEEFEDLEDEEEVKEVAPRRKTKKELAAERRRKAKEAREARRVAAAEKRRKANEARAERARKAKEERAARRAAVADKRRKAKEERERKRRAAAEKRRKEREARIAARKTNNSGDEEDLEDEEEFDDLEDEEGFDDLEDEEDFDDEEDLEDEEDLDDEGSSKKTRTASADEGDDDDLDEDPLLTKKAGETKGPIGAPAVLFNAGLGFSSRNLTFTSDSALMDGEVPIDYEGGFVPTLAVDAEVYPLALTGSKGLMGNIGFDLRFEQAAALSSTVDPDGGAADNAFDVDTTYRRFGAGLRYRMALGSMTLGLRAGYGQSVFELDKGAAAGMVDIPNVKYAFVDPGVSILYPLGKLSIDAGARFLLMLSAGEIQTRDSYGQASILAFDAGAGVNYAVTRSIGVRLGARLAQVNFSFKGTGTLSDRNGDATQDVDSASDQYLGGSLTANYRF